MRFAVDATLGKLGRLLRGAGFDTLCQHQHPQRRFWETVDPDRVILTRTRGIQRQFQNRCLIFIRDNDPLRQLWQVAEELCIRQDAIRPFSRCLICNTIIDSVDRDAVQGRVPPYVWHRHTTFNACMRCGRIFWAGSHHDRICRRFETIFQHDERQSHA